MPLNRSLLSNGDCAAAFVLHEQLSGGKCLMMTHGALPMAQRTPLEWRGKSIHARMQIGDDTLMGSDAPPDRCN